MTQQKHRYTGLTAAEVNQSRAQHGTNVLTPPEKQPLWRQFLEKFSDPLIIILLIAGVLSIGISFYERFGLGEGAEVFFEPVGIFIAIFLATGLAFYFELQADKEFNLLNQVNDDEQVEVVREGNTTQVPRRDIVVGDIVILSTGQEVPADAQLLEATHLSVDESTLTGEPLCQKTTDPAQFDSNATYTSNLVMKGTKVMEGHGICRITAVGDHTEQGKVFEAAQIDSSVKTPLNEQLDGLGKLITKASYVIAALIVVGRIVMCFVDGLDVNHSLHISGAEIFATNTGIATFVAYVLQTLMIAVTLIVVSVPEGLPMAVTLSLAYSMRRMLRTNNLVRKMHACETMGATTVICTDKTGTLTQNQMRIDEVNFYAIPDGKLTDNDESRLIKEGIAVNSTAALDLADPVHPTVLGNPTEGALLLWLYAAGEDYVALREGVQVVEELPFTTERKYMATLVRSALMPGKRILYVKGAPEIVRSLCATVEANVSNDTINAQLLAYQNRAMRTLGFAYQIVDDDAAPLISEGKVVATHLHFMGVVAIADPVRQDVPAAVKECLDAGINIKIVTGDTPGTAKEIGRQIGLWQPTDTDRNIITGPEFAALSDQELEERILDLKIISRARPMDKKRLVETLQRLGQVVAVTGDGTNDAPALKAAQVGLSMGDGTSVAKEASDITILDNSFSSIVQAVMWGRSLYRNIQRFLMFQLTINVVACAIVLIGSLIGTGSPLTITQMLWVNLIMDTFAAGALASLPPSWTVMRDRPRRSGENGDFIISKPMARTIFGTGMFFTALLVAVLLVLQDNGHLSPRDLSWFFTFFVMLQVWNMFNAKAFMTGRSAFAGIWQSKSFLWVIALIIGGQYIIVTFGGKMFNVVPLSLTEWLCISAMTMPVLLFGEIARLIQANKTVK